MKKMLTGLLLLLIFCGLAFLQYQNQELRTEVAELQIHIEQLEELNQTQKETIDTLKKQSVQGILKDTNDALLEGWGNVMKAMENELQEAREALKRAGESKDQSKGSSL